MLSKVDVMKAPICKIWFSEHVLQYRWVLNFGTEAHEVFTGNAKSLEQAMRGIDICRGIFEDSQRSS